MAGERIEEEHEGERYLRLLGLEHLAAEEITAGGRTLQARDFLEVCGDQARPVLIGFEAMSTDDPQYEPAKEALRVMIGRYVGKEVS